MANRRDDFNDSYVRAMSRMNAAPKAGGHLNPDVIAQSTNNKAIYGGGDYLGDEMGTTKLGAATGVALVGELAGKTGELSPDRVTAYELKDDLREDIVEDSIVQKSMRLDAMQTKRKLIKEDIVEERMEDTQEDNLDKANKKYLEDRDEDNKEAAMDAAEDAMEEEAAEASTAPKPRAFSTTTPRP
jgi:hypothetical protein